MDAANLASLQRVFRKETGSLLQYVSQADAWTTKKGHHLREQVRKFAHEERDGIGQLARFLLRHHALPAKPGSYPMSFTTINFCSLEYLLPYLVDFEQKSIREIEAELHTLTDEDARKLVRDYLDLKQRHLQALSSADHHAEPAAAPGPGPGPETVYH